MLAGEARELSDDEREHDRSWPTELRLNPDKNAPHRRFRDGARYALARRISAGGIAHRRSARPWRRHKPPTVTGKENVKIARLEPVGNYAVRIVFDDGHDSGLYSWDYLARAGARASHERSAAARADAVAASAAAHGRRAASASPSSRARTLAASLDFYHGVLTASWPVFILQLAALFLTVNLIFALLYVLDRGGIANARPGNFADAFFFSVQTLGTLGYGVMAPRTLYANMLVTAESFTGILTIALFTGIMFARFSRPFARVVFSKVAVVAPFDGVPTLMFRAANQRGNSILDASVTVSLARQYTTLEGVEMRRFHELKLLRSSNPLFALVLDGDASD